MRAFLVWESWKRRHLFLGGLAYLAGFWLIQRLLGREEIEQVVLLWVALPWALVLIAILAGPVQLLNDLRRGELGQVLMLPGGAIRQSASIALITVALFLALLASTALLSAISLQDTSAKAPAELLRLALYLGLSAGPPASALALLSAAAGVAYAEGRAGPLMAGFIFVGGPFLAKQIVKLLFLLGIDPWRFGSVFVGKFDWIHELAGSRVQISGLPSNEAWPLGPILLGILSLALAIPLAARMLAESEV